jgi:magnesium transporter
MMADCKTYYINLAGKLNNAAGLPEALEAIQKNGGYVWLDYCQPSRADLESLIEPLGLHPLSIEDSLDEEQIPKVEDYPSNTFILFNTFQYAEKVLTVSEIDLFIGTHFLVSVSQCDAQHPLLLSNIARQINQDSENARAGPAFLAHMILDWVVDQKFVAIESLEEDLNQAEDIIIEDHTIFVPAELVRQRRDLLTLRKSLFHEREVLVKICRKDCLFIPQQAILYYRDIYDHLAKSFELTESYRDLVTSLMEMYLAMINNQMTRLSNDTNVTVRRLTFITTIFMPLTLLAGIGGMSEWSMMTGPDNWRIAYPAFLLGMAVLGIANYFLLKWLEKRRKN